MAKYRIKIEALDPSEELRAEYRIGMGCDGFCLILNSEDHTDPDADVTGVCWENLSALDAAMVIADDSDLIEAAHIAVGMDRDRDACMRIAAREKIKAFFDAKDGDDDA